MIDPAADDAAVEKILELVNPDEKNESPAGQLRRHGEGDANDDRVADQVADDREHTADESENDDEAGVAQADREAEDRGQGGVDRGNNDLRAHDGGEALVKRCEPVSDLRGVEAVEVRFRPVFHAPRLEVRIQKHAHRDHDSDEQEDELLRRDLHVVTQLAERVAHALERDGAQAVDIGKGQFDAVLLREADDERDGGFDDFREGDESALKKEDGSAKDGGDDDQEQHYRDPLLAPESELAQREVTKESDQKRRPKLQPGHENQENGKNGIGNGGGLLHACFRQCLDGSSGYNRFRFTPSWFST